MIKNQFINSNNDKVPVNLAGFNVDHTNPKNWLSYGEALSSNGLNVSYVLNGSGEWCLDIDKCINDGGLSELGRELLLLCHTHPVYIETSISGTGLHVWGRIEGEPPPHTCKDTSNKLELYTDERHIVLGQVIPNSPLPSFTDIFTAAPSNELFTNLVAKHFTFTGNGESVNLKDWKTGATLTGAAMLKEILSRKSASATNPFSGAMSLTEILNLSHDEWLASDKSSVDMSLLNHLAFHCSKNHEQMELTYRASNIGAFRSDEATQKLDRLTGTDGDGNRITYLQRSIMLAVNDCKNSFTTKDELITETIQRIENVDGLPDSPCGYYLKDFYIIYKGDGCKFFHGVTGNELGKGCFKDAFKIGPYEFEQAAPDRILAGKTYSPGDALVCEDSGVRLLNTWTPTPTPEPLTESDAGLLNDYFRALCPDAKEREHLLKWCGHLIQRPKIKILHAIMLYGADNGTGKSTLGTILSKALGEENTARINNNTLSDQFNGWLCNSTFGWSDELNTNYMSPYKKHNVVELVKEWVTNRSIPIREMYQATTNAKNNINGFLFTSNNDDALPIDENDRRFFVLQIAHNMLTKTMIVDGSFTRINQELTPGQLVTYFQSIDISDFNPMVEAPMTRAKLEMIDNTTDDLSSVILDEIEDSSNPLATSDYLFIGKIADKHGVPVKALTRQARRLGYVKVNKGGVRYWCKNGTTMSHCDIVSQYQLIR